MFKPILKFSNKTLVVLFEVSAILFFLLAVAFAVFAWRLSQGPISLAFAKEYIQKTLSSESDGFAVTFDDIVLTWPKLSGRFQMDMKDLRLAKGGRDENALSIQEASVGLSRRALLLGRIRPISVIIKEPSLELVRSSAGTLEVFIRSDKKADEALPQEDVTSQKTYGEDIASIFNDMAEGRRGSFFSRLTEFHVERASVAIRDQKYGLSWYLTDLDFDLVEHFKNIEASVNIPLPGGREKDANIAFNIIYHKSDKNFVAQGRVQDMNPYMISHFLPLPDVMAGQNLYFSGDMTAALNNDFVLTDMTFSGAIPEGTISIPSQFDDVISLKNILVQSRYDGDSKTLILPKISGEIGGIPFDGQGAATQENDVWKAPIKLSFPTLTSEQILKVFPKSEHDGEAYAWLGHKIEGADYKNVSLDMRLTATKTRNEELQRDEWDIKTPKLEIGFTFDGAKVTYNDTLMPVENASGHGTLDLATEVLEVVGDSATIGDIKGSDVSVKVTDLMRAGAGHVYIKAKLDGPVSTALSYIAADPINMGEKEIGIDAKKVSGNIVADLDLSMPTLKDVPKEQVNVNINGTMTQMNVPDIVSGLALSGGPLTLVTQAGGFKINGKAQLAGRDTTLDWHQYFESKGKPYSSKIIASVGADKELRNHFGVDLDDYISGTLPVDIVYTLMGDRTASVDVKADLTPMQIHIDPFKFEKPAGDAGTLSLKATLKDDVLKELSEVNINSDDFKVSNATIGFAPLNGKKADLSKGTLPDVTLGKTKMAVSFAVSDANVMQIKATGSVFDMAPFLADGKPADTQGTTTASTVKEKRQPMDITLNAQTMLLENKQEGKEGKAFLKLDDEGDITHLEYDCVVGKSPLSVRFMPESATGKRTFRLETNDGGNALYAFGIYENIHGGTLKIFGEPKGNDLNGNIYGTMRMENFRVVKAPALASLLSLMSLSGVGQLLNNEGLVFSKLESGFEWRFRDSGNLLVIKDGKTSGSSIGLTFSGYIDRGKQKTDIAGTIIPMTEVNSILSKIPLVGEILGGSTGLIAATYSMKGPSNNPTVSVNPLSVLAPGIIRRILFEGGYERKIPGEDEDKKAEKDKQAAPAKPEGAVNK